VVVFDVDLDAITISPFFEFRGAIGFHEASGDCNAAQRMRMRHFL